MHHYGDSILFFKVTLAWPPLSKRAFEKGSDTTGLTLLSQPLPILLGHLWSRWCFGAGRAAPWQKQGFCNELHLQRHRTSRAISEGFHRGAEGWAPPSRQWAWSILINIYWEGWKGEVLPAPPVPWHTQLNTPDAIILGLSMPTLPWSARAKMTVQRKKKKKSPHLYAKQNVFL